jgi:hypothetical protein
MNYIILIASNILLLIIDLMFFKFRYDKLNQIKLTLGLDYNLIDVLLKLHYELFTTIFGFLSLIGLIIFKKSNFFIAISLFYGALQVISIPSGFSFNILYLVNTFSTFLFLYIIITKKEIIFCNERRFMKLIILVAFVFVLFIYQNIRKQMYTLPSNNYSVNLDSK